ncbi:MAG: repressor LexA, partial [Chloroflexi bacterium]|nr:repressor LexA [Chloroflexota bacterium]
MKEISAKQRRILEYIGDFIGKHEYPPSIRQIQESCQISSTSVVDYNLRILER